jgi:deazaflavin-dependent oxidoreductase (nitroreductase family)
MTPEVARALERGQPIDITTTGRRSGRPHRVEVGLFAVRDRVYLTGFPGRRDWYANLLAEPRFVVHLAGAAPADLAALARPVTDPDERAAVLGELAPRLGQRREDMLAGGPLVEVSIPAP